MYWHVLFDTIGFAMYEVLVEQNFSSAHYLRNYHGQDEPLHGHNWKVQVRYRGKKLAEPEQYLVDFVEVRDLLAKVLARIDYKNINDVPPFNEKNPSAENIAAWIHAELSRALPSCPPASVTVWETPEGAAVYSPD